MLKKFVAIAALAFLTACAGSGEIKWDHVRQIKEGMTKQEVMNLMGKPYMVTAASDGTEKWVWVYANGFTGASGSAHLTFTKEGKVLQAPKVPDSF